MTVKTYVYLTYRAFAQVFSSDLEASEHAYKSGDYTDRSFDVPVEVVDWFNIAL